MQLNEILEENTISTISQKTNITQRDLEALIDSKFDRFSKTKTLGLISIIEREFKVNLDLFREDVYAYYKENNEFDGVAINAFTHKESKGVSALLIIVVIVLLALASWFFLGEFNEQNQNSLNPISKAIDSFMQDSPNNTK